MRVPVVQAVGGIAISLSSMYGLGVASNEWLTFEGGGWPVVPALVAGVVAAVLGLLVALAPASALTASVTLLIAAVAFPLLKPGLDLTKVPLHPLDVGGILAHAGTSPLTTAVLVGTGVASGIVLLRSRHATRVAELEER